MVRDKCIVWRVHVATLCWQRSFWGRVQRYASRIWADWNDITKFDQCNKAANASDANAILDDTDVGFWVNDALKMLIYNCYHNINSKEIV